MALRPLRGPGSLLHAQARLAWYFDMNLCYVIRGRRPHRLEARTWPSQGQNTGSIPVGAIRTPVRFPLCAYPTESPDRTVHFPAIVLFRLTLRKPGFDFLKSCTACF